MDCEFRIGTPGDSAEILDLIADAFDINPDSLRFPRQRALAYDAPHEFRLMIRDGRIIAGLHIGDTWIQVGDCAVLKGDVGHVAVRTELQGQGLGSLLMREAVEWMRDNGYHLSRLGGLMHFYSRFGYEPFPRRFVEFRVEQIQGGAKSLSAAEAHPEPTGFEGTLRPFDEARDWQARAHINYVFDHGRSGAARVSKHATPPGSPAPPDPELLRFVYELDGEVKGYLFAVESPLEARDNEPCFSIGAFAYLPDCPEAAGLLLRQLLARLAQHAPVRVTSRLPFDEHLAIALQNAGVGFQRIEMHQSGAGNMIQVLNLQEALKEIAPELSARLADSLLPDWSGAVEFVLPGQSATLSIADGRATAIAATQPNLRLKMTQAEFVKLLFGINGFGELPCARLADLDRRQVALMDALFPRCPAGSGPWG